MKACSAVGGVLGAVVLTVVPVLMAACAAPDQSGEATTHREAQLRAADIPPAVMQALRERSSGAVLPSHVRFARDETSRDVPAVPAGVREDVAKWIRKVVREEWLPEEMTEKMTGEIRWMESVAPPSGDRDFVRLEYVTRDAGSFSIVEGLNEVSIVWHREGIQPGENPEEAAAELARKLLRVPEESASELTADLTPVGDAETRLYVGSLRIPREAGAYPNWFNYMPTWTCPGYFYVTIPVKRTGEKPRLEEMRARPKEPERRF